MSRVTIGPFSVDAPPGWTLSTVILAGPVDDARPVAGPPAAPRRFQRNLVVTMEEVSGDTPESYVDRQVAGLRQAGVSRREADDRQLVALERGGEGLLTEQVIQGSGGELVRQMQLVCIKDGVAFTLILSHLEGTPFEMARDEFRALLLSFA